MDGLRRVLENLLGNAVKYGLTDSLITIAYARKGASIELSVQNFGSELNQSEISKMFHYQQRLLPHNEQNTQGWGIGLTLVKGIVEGHSGKVEVKSSRKEGTVFTVTLPLDSRPVYLDEKKSV